MAQEVSTISDKIHFELDKVFSFILNCRHFLKSLIKDSRGHNCCSLIKRHFSIQWSWFKSLFRMITPIFTLLASATLTSGSPQPANKSSTSWSCPEYAVDFIHGDITHYDNIATWQECGKLLQLRYLIYSIPHTRWDLPSAQDLQSLDLGCSQK